MRELVALATRYSSNTMPDSASAAAMRSTSPQAPVLGTYAEVFERAAMIVKVKEPQPVECRRLRTGQLLFTYLHLAPDPEQTRLLVGSGDTAIAYETVTGARGGLPLLADVLIAGRMAIQAGAHALEKAHGGPACCSAACPAWRRRR